MNDLHKHYRAADPPTSRAAIASHDAAGKRETHREAALAAVRAHPNKTAVELLQHLPSMDRHEVSRRLADLKNDGLVVQAISRLCSVRGTRMVTWREPAWPAHRPPLPCADENQLGLF